MHLNADLARFLNTPWGIWAAMATALAAGMLLDLAVSSIADRRERRWNERVERWLAGRAR